MPYPLVSPTVLELSKANPFQDGNFLMTIDEWRAHIKAPKKVRGKDLVRMRTHDAAVNLYAEVVSWYMPSWSKRADGSKTKMMQRFSGEYFQHSYKAILNRFDYENKKAREAYDILEQLGLVERIYVKRQSGTKFYVKLFFRRLQEISSTPLDNGWQQALYNQCLVENKSTRLNDFDREELLRVSQLMLDLHTNDAFIDSSKWLNNLTPLQLKNLLRLCTRMRFAEDEFKKVENKAAFIKSTVENGEYIVAPEAWNEWLAHQLEVAKNPDYLLTITRLR